LEINAGAVQGGINVFGSNVPVIQVGPSATQNFQQYWNGGAIMDTYGYSDWLKFAGSYLIFAPAGVEAMRIINGGNVGIGTTNPIYGKLQIDKLSTWNSEGSAGLSITTGTNAQPELQFGADNGNTLSYIQSLSRSTAYPGVPLCLQPNGGYVGIGTTSPGNTLTIGTAGNASASMGISDYQSVVMSTNTNVTPTCSRLEVSGGYTATLQAGTLPAGTVLIVTGGSGYPTIANGNGVSYQIDSNHGIVFCKALSGVWQFIGSGHGL
jgi:hypothetical protein